MSMLTVLCCLAALTACSGSGGDVLGALTLRVALSRIAATDDTRGYLSFDDTARLVALSGKDWGGPPGGFGSLRGQGADALVVYGAVVSERPGINLLDADYTITAGQPPHQLSMITGGQRADQITRGLTDLGWHADAGRLVSPGIGGYKGPDELGPLALQLAQVRVAGSDLVYGGADAHLDAAGKPSGSTLAGDPRISALAGCLGDVVAAVIATPKMSGKLHPTAVAVGVRAPGQSTDTPRGVACLSWASADEAHQYASLLDRSFQEGQSGRTAKPWKEILHSISAKDVGGGEHIVAWEADMPGNATLVIKMLQNLDLPAFPCDDRMPPAARAKLGC
jgi:hypothetical protein